MPGVGRPQTLTDVLGALNQQSSSTSSMITGLAGYLVAPETAAVADSMTVTAQTPPGWDQSTWGGFVWG